MIKQKPTCPHCGSNDVLNEAWTSWNIEEQAWVFEDTRDSFYCRTCDAEFCDPLWEHV